jgi:hypothetical protein
MLTDMLAPWFATVFRNGEDKVHGGRDQGTSGLAEPPWPIPETQPHREVLRFCCVSAGIRGRSTAGRAVDLGWS